MRNAKGFTLIEVLVATTIVAVIAAVVVARVAAGGSAGPEVAARATASNVAGALVSYRERTGTFDASTSDLNAIASSVSFVGESTDSSAGNQVSLHTSDSVAAIAVYAGEACVYVRIDAAPPYLIYYVDETASSCQAGSVINQTPSNAPGLFDGTGVGSSFFNPVILP